MTAENDPSPLPFAAPTAKPHLSLGWRLFKRWVRRSVHAVVVGRSRSTHAEDGRFLEKDIDPIVEAAWERLPELFAGLSPEATTGSRLNVRLASLTLAFFESLVAIGIERSHAIELTSDLTWKFYAKGATVARLARGRGSRSGLGFLEKAAVAGLLQGDPVSLGFPFNPPGYLARYVPTTAGIGFDVVRCPVAEFFLAHGAADLCVSTWCNLDFPLSEVTGQKLTRAKTLANGDGRCTFRLTPVPAKGTALP